VMNFCCYALVYHKDKFFLIENHLKKIYHKYDDILMVSSKPLYYLTCLVDTHVYELIQQDKHIYHIIRVMNIHLHL
jgi:hypothetical protein